MGCLNAKQKPTATKYEVVNENGEEVKKEVVVKKEEKIPTANHKKILFVGSDYTGKTSIIKQFTQNTFEDYVSATTIVSNFSKIVETALVNGKLTKFKLDIWDSPGEDTYRNIRKNFYQGSHLVVVVYDVTNPKSFRQLKDHMNDVVEVC